MSYVEIQDLKVRYGDFQALKGISFAVGERERICLLGPSGCGKTTALQVLAGFVSPESGEVRLAGRSIIGLVPEKRNIGIMFQNYALFPHMTVAENVAFGLSIRKVPSNEMAERVRSALDLVRMGHFADRLPSQLSGGQRQRIALARALVTRPKVLLLDEPLAALDKKLREQMQVEIRQLQQQVGITTIFVTHDQEEALTLSDRIVVMEQGEVVQIGTPAEVYEYPRTRFVSDFIGFASSLKGRVVSVRPGRVSVDLLNGVEPFEVETADGFTIGQDVEAVIRPEKISVQVTRQENAPTVSGRVTNIVYTGALSYIHVDLGGDQQVVAMLPNEGVSRMDNPIQTGSVVWVHWHPSSVRIFAKR